MTKYFILFLFTSSFLAQENYERSGGEYYPEQYLSKKDSLKWPLLFDISLDVKDIKGLDVNQNEFYSKLMISSYSEYDTTYITNNKIDTVDLNHSEWFVLETKENNLNNSRGKLKSKTYFKDNYNYLFYDDFYSKTVTLVESPFDVNWDLKDYPFDVQQLKFKFTSKVDSSVIRLRPSKDFLSTFEPNMDNLAEGFTINEVIEYNYSYNQDASDIIRTSPGPNGLRPIVTETLEVVLNLDRTGSWLYLKLFFGGFISFFISWILFFIPQRQFESRTNLAVAAVFGALGNKYFVESTIPSIQVLTKADVINNVIILLIAYNILIMIAQQNKKMNWSILETDKGALIKTGLLFIIVMFIIRIY